MTVSPLGFGYLFILSPTSQIGCQRNWQLEMTSGSRQNEPQQKPAFFTQKTGKGQPNKTKIF